MSTKILKYYLIFILLFCGLQNIRAQQNDTLKDKKNTVTSPDLPDSIKKLPARVATLEKKAGVNNTAVKDTTQGNCDTCAVKCNVDVSGFHLHPTFADPNPVVDVINGKAELNLVSYGSFTVGAETDDKTRKFKLDLAKDVPGMSEEFKQA